MANAAHQLAELLSSWRGYVPANSQGILAKSASELGLSEADLLVHAGDLARRTNRMFAELEASGEELEHFSGAKTAWTLAPFMYGAGWTSGGNLSADHVIHKHNLSLLKAFAALYDHASRVPMPNAAAVRAFVVELGPIADFVAGLDIESASKALILAKIQSTKAMLESDDFQFEIVLTRLGEVIGLLIILAESGISDEDKEKVWQKVRGFAATFGRDMTVNIVSGALSSGIMGAIAS